MKGRIQIAAKEFGNRGLRAFVRRVGFVCEGAQLLEFALVLPFFLVIAVGIMDFGHAYNLKQMLNNAARDGARFAASESSLVADLSDTSCSSGPASVCAIRDVVQNYVTNATGNTTCTLDTGPTPVTVAGTTQFGQWTFSSSTCSGYALRVERAYSWTYTATSGTGAAAGTRITLAYPFTWSVTGLMRLLVPGSTFSAPATISSNAIMQNLS